MSINVFFLLVLAMLIGMFSCFKPGTATDSDAAEIPKIELYTFTLYEISPKGVEHVLEGKEGKMFNDRYEVTSAKFSDNTGSLVQSVSADTVLYKKPLVNLDKEVHYEREDGLEFRSREARYNTDTATISTEGAFVLTQRSNRVDGKKLTYNTRTDDVLADDVRGSYQFD